MKNAIRIETNLIFFDILKVSILKCSRVKTSTQILNFGFICFLFYLNVTYLTVLFLSWFLCFFCLSDFCKMDRKRSNVWLHFTKEKAKCNICRAIFSHKSGGTSNLRKHLIALHPTVNIEGDVPPKKKKTTSATTVPPTLIANTDVDSDEVVEVIAPEVRRQPKQTKLTEFRRPNMSIARKLKLDRMLLLMIVKDMQPFSVVEDAGFINFVSEL